MLISRSWRATVLVVMLALVAAVPAGASAQTKDDVDQAEDRLDTARDETKHALDRWRESQAELETALLALEEVTTQKERLVYTIGLLDHKIEAYQSEVTDLELIARNLVVEAYISGGRSIVATAFEVGSIQDLLTSQVLIDNAADRDLADLNRLQSVSREMDRLTLDLDGQRVEVEALEAETAALVQRTGELAEQTRAVYASATAAERAAIDSLAKERRELQAAEARRKAADAARVAGQSGKAGGLPPEATPGFRCPVQGGASFVNTWGAPRSGGRRHKGVDMFNTRNTPLVAVVDGRVRFSSNGLGGVVTHLYGDDGTTYYYAHLESHPTGISSGQRVSAGTVVGYVGNSGNARYTSPHVHFEIRPNGVAVNPYPTVRHYC
ncbi:MAG: hypothetical protein BMS9Abin07_1783 [Acidimicrobiia bacterium]|nr:MAG: hypothetical protein BMS9Abin07_1783 [Acidimicrobiia bacterium]